MTLRCHLMLLYPPRRRSGPVERQPVSSKDGPRPPPGWIGTAIRVSVRSGARETPMPQQIRAIVVDPAAPGKLAIRPVELRDPDRDEVGVSVTAISLNRG